MIAPIRGPRPRAGITLTEILISILIMGVGLISLATLFPLGLIRLREATRNSRSGLLFESAADDMDARQLLFKQSFWNTWYWYNSSGTPSQVLFRDPFTQDGTGNADPTVDPTTNKSPGYITSSPFGANAVVLKAAGVDFRTGLPVCYDPLWRSVTGIAPSPSLFSEPFLHADKAYFAPSGPKVDDARFGSGIFSGSYPYLRIDPSGTAPSAYGLQRITNFIPWNTTGGSAQYNFTCHNFALTGFTKQPGDVAADIFVSQDDLVFNQINNGISVNGTDVNGNAGSFSSVLPDMTGGVPQLDYRFTWFFTGHQADAGVNSTQFTGDVVVCENRPFAYDPVPGGGYAPAGETVVEGIFGVGSATGGIVNDRAVLLRWKSTLPDPTVRAGSWIADVTYEPLVTNYVTRVYDTTSSGTPTSTAGIAGTPFARCIWYRVAKVVDPQVDPILGSPYRSMTVTLTAPVKIRTALDSTTGAPIHINAALIMPSVISVYPRAFEVH